MHRETNKQTLSPVACLCRWQNDSIRLSYISARRIDCMPLATCWILLPAHAIDFNSRETELSKSGCTFPVPVLRCFDAAVVARSNYSSVSLHLPQEAIPFTVLSVLAEEWLPAAEARIYGRQSKVLLSDHLCLPVVV